MSFLSHLTNYQEFEAEKMKEPIEDQLRRAYEKGHRYVVQSLDDKFPNCFSLKPKKYRDIQSWGYQQNDINKKEALPAEIIWGSIESVKWSDRSPKEISKLINLEEIK